MTHRFARGLAGALLLLALPLSAQQPDAAELQPFFDQIHAPNWLGTDIAHTSVKAQRGGTCWSFATVSFLESEVLRQNPEAAGALAESGEELNLSEYYIVYWAWVEKAREYVGRRGAGFHSRRGEVPLGDGGLPHDVTRIVRDYGIVPETAYVVPEVDGRRMTPRQFATEHLGLEPDAYVELMSYTDTPFYMHGEVDVPDNWWDYDEYVNVPLDAFVRAINRVLDAGYSVAFDTDWGDLGTAWNRAGLAVIHPAMTPGYMIDQETRQRDFEERRTTDDHLVHAVDHRVVDGHDWYLIKNSHGIGTGRRGYVWMRGDWLALRVLNVMMHRDAVGEALLARIE